MLRLLAALALIISSQFALAAEPSFDFTLASNKGKNLRLAEQRGEVIMLNFWASWCGPCRQEMPLLDELHARYEAAGFQVWGVNVDSDRADANKMLAKIPVDFPILFDSAGEVSKKYGIDAMPSSVFIDRDGNVRHIHRGYRDGDLAAYKKIIKELIRE
ncbi:TlpA disulfide reductase family protein [Microbulbifer thermotolerans]|uniref:Redoxin n=1 Tax=Microbulbifer thermotolerans TaxID=252514 RepID=A0A143HQE3_MICTH|nr:TlpA disulfide reductase family protein [Microbulbifer thermotolerans]AMX03721.1 redoxin [Microbulbifer thermotolerans]MCX2780658.1 TlpA family protein disulfide reductase [Microbulbifer thermotolerans]MCX2783616.1 TlpA family protein disulfide reductase [Microbulbifer thermotolerans]MCX2795827.1 TlpA family protein disulfide reductase [Microbulbifer thermotolerans]MCX2801991.1 TlpA family protein disulfide reductase [Microbulbifer thermotolerans]